MIQEEQSVNDLLPVLQITGSHNKIAEKLASYIKVNNSIDNLKGENIRKVIGVYKKGNSHLLDIKNTYVMGIINCTNDSFSEGGLLKNYNLPNKDIDYHNIIKTVQLC